jgi:rhodanese-related sulfurtransferase
MKTLYFIILTLPILAILALQYHASYGNRLISDSKLFKLSKQSKIPIIVDVRTTTEWNQGHFPDAIHLPVQDIIADHNIVNNLREWTKSNDHIYNSLNQPCILVYCRTGNRARIGAEKLAKHLHSNACIYYTTRTYTELENMLSGMIDRKP